MKTSKVRQQRHIYDNGDSLLTSRTLYGLALLGLAAALAISIAGLVIAVQAKNARRLDGPKGSAGVNGLNATVSISNSNINTTQNYLNLDYRN